MANRRAMKLFAVAMVVGGSAAHADTATQGRPAAGNTVAKPSAVDQTRTALAEASLAYQAANAPIVINPRLLANARPACGNTGGKVDRPADCTANEIRAVRAYEEAYEREARKRDAKVRAAYQKLMAATEAAVRVEPTLAPRLLVNGRPACGNTMGKSRAKPDCRVDAEPK